MEEEIKKEFEKQEKRFDEMMEFLVGNMATKDDIADVRRDMATKDDIARLDIKIDSVRDELMQEVRSVNSDIEEIKKDLERLEKRIGEDLDIYASDIIDLRTRVKVLERQIKEMQPA